MSPTDNTPDFDNMSPEEVMAWMESLAKRQGANEGFTTAADLDVPEIDPDSVVIDEPGYIPYGQEETSRKAPAASPPPPAPVAPPLPPPMPIPTPAPEPVMAQPPEPMQLPLSDIDEAEEEEADTALEAAMGENALAWLESLAADQGSTDLDIDLSTIEPEPVEASRPPIDPQEWLQGIADAPELSTTFEVEESFIEDEESDEVEFTPEPPASREPLRLENPASLLDSLAVAAGFEDDAVRTTPEFRPQAESESDMTLEGIERAIRAGRVTPNQMKRYQELQMERAAQIPETEDLDFDPDAPAEQAPLPEWLEELNPEAEAEDEEAVDIERPPLEALFEAPPAPTTEIPDWLDDEGAATETVASIFDDTPTPPAGFSEADVEIDTSDPWVQAFEEEYQSGQSEDLEPEWYTRNINDPNRVAILGSEAAAAVEEPELEPEPEMIEVPVVASVSVATELAEAALPSETSLPAGERQAVPVWMTTTATQTMMAAPAEAAEAETEIPLPDWLKTDEQPVALDDWRPPASELVETEPVVQPEPASAPEPVLVSPPPPAPVSATLEEARKLYNSEGSLTGYELLVRTSQSLIEVVGDLQQIAQAHKDPAVYRVLGDSLMRQGRLQEALNIYREALNLL